MEQAATRSEEKALSVHARGPRTRGNGGLGSSEQRRGGADGARRTEKKGNFANFLAGYLYLFLGKS